MTLTSRDRRILIIGAVALATLLVGNYVLLPWVDHWQAARRQIAEASAMLAGWESREQRHAIQQTRLQEVFGPGIAAELPSEGEARITFPNTLESVMKRAGLQIRSLNPQPSRAQRDLPGITLVAVQVEGQCQLPQLERGLAELAKADQIILVDRLSAAGVPNREGHVDVSLILSTPARVEETP